MDSSRDRDLYLLKERMEDDSLSDTQRSGARRIFDSIRMKQKDRKLSELRRRLVYATKAADHDAIEALQAHIKEHSYRMGYEKYENISD